MGSLEGVEKTSAARVGVTVEEWRRRRATGEKWCTGCRAWHSVERFPVDRSRGDGRRARCLEADHGKRKGQRRSVEGERARHAVGRAVKTGVLPNPNTLPCSDCDHFGRDRRHEHHHYLGYAREHWLDVQVVCTICHADREKERR